jgi:hypothetical protein
MNHRNLFNGFRPRIIKISRSDFSKIDFKEFSRIFILDKFTIFRKVVRSFGLEI